MTPESDVLPVLRYVGAVSPDASPDTIRGLSEVCRGDSPTARLSAGARALGWEQRVSRVSVAALETLPPTQEGIIYSTAHNAFLIVRPRGISGGLEVRVLADDGPGPRQSLRAGDLSRLLESANDDTLDVITLQQSQPLDALAASEGQPKSEWQRLYALMQPERRDLYVVLAYAVAVGLLSLATPLAVQSLFNTVAFGTVLQPLLVLGVLLMAALAASALIRVFELVVIELIARRIFVRTAQDFSRRVPLVRRDKTTSGTLSKLVNRFYDVVVVEKSVTEILFDGLTSALQIALGLLLLAVYHPYLLVFDIVLVVAFAGIIFGLGRRAVATAVKESKMKHEVAAWIEDVALTPLMGGGWTGRVYAHRRADSLLQGWLQARSEHFSIVTRQFGGVLLLQVFASGLLVLLGGFLVLQGQLSLGQLVAAEVVMTLTVSSLAKIGKLLAKLYDLLAALDKLGSVIDRPSVDRGGELLPMRPEGMALDIRHPFMRLSISPSERVAVAGADIVDALGVVTWLSGLSPMGDGKLAFDGLDSRVLDPAAVADQMVVLERGELFPGSIRDNVALGDPSVSNGEVRDALSTVGLGDLEERFADGLDQVVGRESEPLSEYQAVLVQLARAIALSPRLVVVDRVLDGLPPLLRNRSLDVLLDTRRTWTVLCVTDHPDVLERFSRKVEAGTEDVA